MDMKAAIIGAGIGGLTTAIALQQAGIEYELFEAAPELKPVGAGIVMASNAMQVFQRLGIEKKIMAAGLEIEKAYGVDQSFRLISGLAVKGKSCLTLWYRKLCTASGTFAEGFAFGNRFCENSTQQKVSILKGNQSESKDDV